MMKRMQKTAILLQLVKVMRKHDNWCGETHIQKAVFCLNDLLKVNLDLNFSIYKYGPFSFDLRDELNALYANRLIQLEPQEPPFGPKYGITEQSEFLLKRFPKTLSRYHPYLAFVAETFGDRGVVELERLTTALYISLGDQKNEPTVNRAKELHKIKPHIAIDEAQSAVEEANLLIKKVAKKFKLSEV